ARAVAASVALEVLYDYLDGWTESIDDLGRALALLATLEQVFRLGDLVVDTHCDAGYLYALAQASREAFRSLPSHAAVAQQAAEVAQSCSATQAHCHVLQAREFERWGQDQPEIAGLMWWETAAGRSGGVVTLHALIALAGRSGSTAAVAAQIADA